jgi:Uri superfamily endonuclease
MELKWTADAATLPDTPGAYALLITLDAPAALPAPRFGGVLGPGRYCYLGSARGPGGIRARCARHLRRDKIKRWHVDWLTGVASGLAVSAQTRSTECELAESLIAFKGISIPVAGFGSSDCRYCPAHLVHFDGSTNGVLFGRAMA